MRSKFAQYCRYVLCGTAIAIFAPPSLAGNVYDLAVDWSDTANPNGVWSYNDSNGPIATQQSNWAIHEPFWNGQKAWATSATGPGHIVAWLKSDRDLDMESNGGRYELAIGDVNVHTWDNLSSLSGTSNYSSVKWTAPAAGFYGFTGNIWQAYFLDQRAVTASVWVNDAMIAEKKFFDGAPYDRAAPFTFGDSSVELALNDVIEVRFVTSTQPGTHMGVNLTVTQLLPGDYNSDDVVDAADYTVWRDHLGASAGTLPNDVDGGSIGSAQYDTWKTNLGATAPGFAAATSTPEPHSTACALAAIALTLTNYRRAYKRRHPCCP